MLTLTLEMFVQTPVTFCHIYHCFSEIQYLVFSMRQTDNGRFIKTSKSIFTEKEFKMIGYFNGNTNKCDLFSKQFDSSIMF